MKRYLLLFSLLMSAVCGFAQMSDTQVMQFYAREKKAGTADAQIVTKLMQRGVKIDQLRRIRQQYQKQLEQRSLGSQADAAIGEAESRLRRNNGQERDERLDQPEKPVRRQPSTSGYGSNDPYGMADDDGETLPYGDYTSSKDTIPQWKKVFGRDIFNNKELSFEPNMNIATPQDYVLGPGDQVFVDIYGASQKTEQLEVSPDGTITVPGFGPVQVGGLTMGAAQSRLRATLGSRYASSRIDATVGQTRTITVNVLGEVKAPGTYTLSAFATVFHALYMAGGISDLGTLRNIRVYRQGRLVTVVDIYDYILNGRLSGNVRLRENDVIQVGPYDCLVSAGGSVKRPMRYEMRHTESVAQLLKYAGGFTGDAYTRSVRVTRQTGGGTSAYTVGEFDLSSFNVADGDSVGVAGQLEDRLENTVEVRGAVFRPGQFALGDAATVGALVRAADGVTEDAFTTRAVLHRMRADRTLEAMAIDLRGILDGTAPDVALQNEDVLFVPSEEDRLSGRTLTIEGEVVYPGTYTYAANTTLEDLVLRAGGLTDAASTVRVDVSRRISDPSATTSRKEIAQTFQFALKDGFVIGGEPGFVLEPYDVVQVRRSPGFQEPRTITVEGEVLFGGNYTLVSKNQRLTDAIQAAGGVTPEAYAKGTRLVRTMNDDERAQRDAMVRQLRQQATEKDSVDLAQLNLGNTYSVAIDLEKALANPGSNYDVVLREGDRIIVPEYNGVVKISGNVMSSNTVAYTPGKSYKWYVNQAGGFGDRAKKRASYIVYQNGTMTQARKGTVEPGCEIIVPTKAKKDGNALAQWLAVGTSFASLTTMFATIYNILK